MVRTQRPNCRGPGLNPDWGTKILQAAQGSPPNKLLNSQPLFYTAVLYQKSLKLEAAVKKKKRDRNRPIFNIKNGSIFNYVFGKFFPQEKGGSEGKIK